MTTPPLWHAVSPTVAACAHVDAYSHVRLTTGPQPLAVLLCARCVALAGKTARGDDDVAEAEREAGRLAKRPHLAEPRTGLRPTDYALDDRLVETLASPAEWLTPGALVRHGGRPPSIAEVRARLLVEGDGLALRASTLPGAGLGVFATRPIARGTVITEFAGLVLPRQIVEALRERARPAEQRRLKSHTLPLTKFMLIVGTATAFNPATHALRYIRDPAVELRGQPLGAWANTLYPGPQRDAGAFNAEFCHVVDAELLDVERPGARPLPPPPQLARLVNLPGHQLKALIAVRDIAAGDELLVDYGAAYDYA